LVEVRSDASYRTQAYEVHNLVLGSWYAAGVFGLIGSVIMVLGVLVVGLRCLIDARTRHESLVALALFASLVAFVVFAMGAPVLFQRYAWITAGFMLVLRAHQVRRSARELSEVTMSSRRATPARRLQREWVPVELAGDPVLTGHPIRPLEVDDVGSQEGRGRNVEGQQRGVALQRGERSPGGRPRGALERAPQGRGGPAAAQGRGP